MIPTHPIEWTNLVNIISSLIRRCLCHRHPVGACVRCAHLVGMTQLAAGTHQPLVIPTEIPTGFSVGMKWGDLMKTIDEIWDAEISHCNLCSQDRTPRETLNRESTLTGSRRHSGTLSGLKPQTLNHKPPLDPCLNPPIHSLF